MELAKEARPLCLQQLKSVIYALPASHYATLRAIMLHLRKALDHRRQEAQEEPSKKPGPDAVDSMSKEIEEAFAPLLIHPTKTTHWTGANRTSRIAITNLILHECPEFLDDGENNLNVPNDTARLLYSSLSNRRMDSLQ